MTGIEKQQLEAGARTAVLVRRSDLPVPLAHTARSFLGGLPKLPPEFEWPRAQVTADAVVETVALSFIAQIDLTELPNFGVRPPLPRTGTLYFFCNSGFVGEATPPCRVLYYLASADTLPERQPPPDLMPLAGNGGDGQVKWLDPATDFHSKVEFKYPISFLPFRDFAFLENPIGRELLVSALCEALGPGEPNESDLLDYRTVNDFAKDNDWPFNWLLVTYLARSLRSRVRYDLEPSPYRKPLNDETKRTLQEVEADVNRWLERSGRSPPLETIDADVKQELRLWWAEVALKYKKMKGQVSVYPFQLPKDLGDTINHTIRCMAAHEEPALVNAPRNYVANIEQKNHWKAPKANGGPSRFFGTAIHQVLGYGSSWQDAPDEHRDDVLLLQIQGDDAFFNWHTNCGCVLHFWIGREALLELDFSEVVTTFECD